MCSIMNLQTNTEEIFFVDETSTYMCAEVFSFCHLSQYTLSVWTAKMPEQPVESREIYGSPCQMQQVHHKRKEKGITEVSKTTDIQVQ